MAKKDTENKTAVRVGISETSQELHFDTNMESAKVVALAHEAITGNKTLELIDVKNRELLITIADDFNLAKTGASDYHGNGKLNQLAEFHTDPAEFEKLESAANERRVIRR